MPHRPTAPSAMQSNSCFTAASQETHHGFSFAQCNHQCQLHTTCSSFNHHPESMTCELNTVELSDGVVEPHHGWDFYSVNRNPGGKVRIKISKPKKKKNGGIGWEQAKKKPKIIHIFLNFEAFRWKLLQVWRKNMFSLWKILKIGRHLASKFHFFWKNKGFGWQHTILWKIWGSLGESVKIYGVCGWERC